jgi:hypothetical protein
MLLVVLVAAAAFGQSASSATSASAATPADPTLAAISAGNVLSGSAKTQALAAVLTSIGYHPDTYGVGNQIIASVAAISDSTDKSLAVSYLLDSFFPMACPKAALTFIDTPGLTPAAQWVANSMGISLGRRGPQNLLASWTKPINLGRSEQIQAWYGPAQTDLKRVFVLVGVRENAAYVAAANTWLVQAGTSNVAAVSASYQTYLVSGSGTDILAGVALPTTDALALTASQVLQWPGLSVDTQVDMFLLLGQNAPAFTAAYQQLISGTGAQADVDRMAKVIKAVDGNWARATAYVNCFLPVPAGQTPPVNPLPAVKASLGL